MSDQGPLTPEERRQAVLDAMVAWAKKTRVTESGHHRHNGYRRRRNARYKKKVTQCPDSATYSPPS